MTIVYKYTATPKFSVVLRHWPCPCASRMDAMPINDGLPTNVTAQLHNVTRPKASSTVVCYSPMMITTNGIWQGLNPLEFSLPLFILQTAIIVATTRLLVLLLKPIRQPRVIAEILVRKPEPIG